MIWRRPACAAAVDQCRHQCAAHAQADVINIHINGILDRVAIGGAGAIDRGIRIARDLAVDFRDEIRQAEFAYRREPARHFCRIGRIDFERGEAVQHVVPVDGGDGGNIRDGRGPDAASVLHGAQFLCAAAGKSPMRAISAGVEPLRVGHVIGHHAGGIEAPEQFAVDRERRHAEHAARNRAFAVRAQFVLDRLRRDQALGMSTAQFRAQRLPRPAASSSEPPSRQMKRNIVAMASRRQSSAIASRSARIGLNGCAGGNLSAMPWCRASHCTWR